MAYISSFIYCEGIQVQVTPQGPQPQIVNTLQNLAPIAVPGNYSFAIACTLAGFDASAENKVRLKFVSPSGEVARDTGDVSFNASDKRQKEGKPSTIQFNMDLRNVVLREEGIYATQVFFNGELLNEYKIEVIKGESNGR